MVNNNNEIFKNPTVTKLTNDFDHIHNYDDKTYVFIDVENNKIYFFVRSDIKNYKKIIYEVSGDNTKKFMKLINDFDCIVDFDDIHD